MDENLDIFDTEDLIPAFERLKEILQEAGITYGEGSGDETADSVKPEASAASGKESMYDPDCLLRLEKISAILDEEEELHSGVLKGSIPYLQLQYGELVVTLYYEKDGKDEELFDLHLRCDIPYKGEKKAAERYCGAYESRSLFSKAYTGLEPFPVSGSDPVTEDCITFHACVTENSELEGAEWLSFVVRLFVSEILAQ